MAERYSLSTTYVADTHSLIWYLIGSPQLGVRARQAIDDAVSGRAALIIPVIVLAKLVLLVEKGRILASLDAMLALLHGQEGFLIQPLSVEVVLIIRGPSQLPDIHDRLIVAEALMHNAALITRDRAITSSDLVSVLW